jgi:Holliday junction DNA helicase RuvA
VGEKVVLFTHQAIREDAHLLFGFGNAEERAVFRQLIKITGVARAPRCRLSGMSIADLAQAVTLQESGRLVKVPGIGKKTAERLLLELKGKLGADIGAGGAHAVPDAQSDILNALLALGYSDKEAVLALKTVPAGASVSDGIKQALKALSKG